MFECDGGLRGGGASGEVADGALGAFGRGAGLARDLIGDGAGEATPVAAVPVRGNRDVVGGGAGHCS